MKTTANSNVALYAKFFRDVDGYGELWTRHTPDGLFATTSAFAFLTGSLPLRLATIRNRRASHIIQTVYSYRTPIAWFDMEFKKWVVPNVSYSVTTSKHQFSLWKLSYESPYSTVRFPGDITLDDYLRVLEGKMIFSTNKTLPGPNWTLD